MKSATKAEVMNKLRAIRQAQKLSLWALAARAKTSATTLCAIEKWGYHPGAGLRVRIAAALSVDVTDIWPSKKESTGEPVC